MYAIIAMQYLNIYSWSLDTHDGIPINNKRELFIALSNFNEKIDSIAFTRPCSHI